MKLDKPKIILLHPGKTGGTSIEHTLKDKYLGHNFKLDSRKADRNIMFGLDRELHLYLQHADLRVYDHLNIDYTPYTTITTIRRPYERILSCYYYNGKSTKHTFEDFITNYLSQCHIHNHHMSTSHFSSQYPYTSHNSYKVNYIIQLENFNQDCAKAGLDVTYHYSQTAATKDLKSYMDLYNQRTKDIVYNLYKEDFKTFGYKR
jgi:hypothetical protein